jgi:hypothetical protein
MLLKDSGFQGVKFAGIRGMKDVEFFLYRLTTIFA